MSHVGPAAIAAAIAFVAGFALGGGARGAGAAEGPRLAGALPLDADVATDEAARAASEGGAIADVGVRLTTLRANAEANERAFEASAKAIEGGGEAREDAGPERAGRGGGRASWR